MLGLCVSAVEQSRGAQCSPLTLKSADHTQPHHPPIHSTSWHLSVAQRQVPYSMVAPNTQYKWPRERLLVQSSSLWEAISILMRKSPLRSNVPSMKLRTNVIGVVRPRLLTQPEVRPVGRYVVVIVIRPGNAQVPSGRLLQQRHLVTILQLEAQLPVAPVVGFVIQG